MSVDKNSWEYVSSKLGKITGPTEKRAKEIFDAAKKAGHQVWFMWGYDGNASNTEHHSGRALDFMVRNHADGQWVRDYIWRNRARLRLQHVIWEQHITSTVTSPGVVRKMADRGSPTENHMDHVHALFFTGTYQAPGSDSAPVDPAPPKTKTDAQIVDEILEGKWGNGDVRTQKLRAAGYDPNTIQRLVNIELDKRKAGDKKKTVGQIAAEVIDGKWGTGADRVARLTKAGYNASTVQKEVNRLLLGNNHAKKSINQLAAEVMRGEWGDGDVRVQRLTRAGYNAKAVQAEVNRRV
jgi:hypothetical protein